MIRMQRMKKIVIKIKVPKPRIPVQKKPNVFHKDKNKYNRKRDKNSKGEE